MKQMIDDYFNLQAKVHEAFGYKEDWVVIPLEDSRKSYWSINGNDEDGDVVFADSEEQLRDEEAGDYYSHEIYTQRFLHKYVYRTEEYTMICVDTHCDGNKFLQIFDNEKEIKDL